MLRAQDLRTIYIGDQVMSLVMIQTTGTITIATDTCT